MSAGAPCLGVDSSLTCKHKASFGYVDPSILEDAYPVGMKSGSMQLGTLDGSWTALSSDALAQYIDAGAQEAMPRTSRAACDDAPSEVTEGSPPAWKPETLHIATH